MKSGRRDQIRLRRPLFVRRGAAAPIGRPLGKKELDKCII
nr:MAG TPA: hypothetical protein [Microviridae sp.]